MLKFVNSQVYGGAYKNIFRIYINLYHILFISNNSIHIYKNLYHMFLPQTILYPFNSPVICFLLPLSNLHLTPPLPSPFSRCFHVNRRPWCIMHALGKRTHNQSPSPTPTTTSAHPLPPLYHTLTHKQQQSTTRTACNIIVHGLRRC